MTKRNPKNAVRAAAGVSMLILIAAVVQCMDFYESTTDNVSGSIPGDYYLLRRNLQSVGSTAVIYTESDVHGVKYQIEREKMKNQQKEEQWPPKEVVDAMVDYQNRVIVIGVNCGFIDMADNYLNSVVKLGVTNFVIVPLDSKAHRMMSEAYPGHVVPVVPELKGVELEKQASYRTEGFRVLTSIRPTFLLHFLEAGYSVFYNDVDMVWRRNAFASLMELNQDKAFLVPGKGGKYGDGACTSTIFMRPTKKNRNFVSAWKREMAKGFYENDQFGFNAVLNSQPEGESFPIIWGNDEEFPTARDYFGPDSNKRDRAYVVHNNGLKLKDEKVKRFKRFKMWELSGRVGQYQCEASTTKTEETDVSI